MNDVTSQDHRPLYTLGWLRYVKEGSDQWVDPELMEQVSKVDPRLVIPLALSDANEIRRALAIGEGKLEKLPTAVLGNSEDCVLARALSNGWKAAVTSSETTIAHSPRGITLAQVKLAVEALNDLGFIGVTYSPSYEISIDQEGFDSYYISIPHTWAMEQFVNWYDRGAFPELVLDEDNEGQQQVAKFQSWRDNDISFEDISAGRVHSYQY